MSLESKIDTLTAAVVRLTDALGAVENGPEPNTDSPFPALAPAAPAPEPPVPAPEPPAPAPAAPAPAPAAPAPAPAAPEPDNTTTIQATFPRPAPDLTADELNRLMIAKYSELVAGGKTESDAMALIKKAMDADKISEVDPSAYASVARRVAGLS